MTLTARPLAAAAGVVTRVSPLPFDWNPVSAAAAAVRDLWGNPNPSSLVHAWPMQHPVAASIIWSLAILAVCTVVATRLFQRRTAH